MFNGMTCKEAAVLWNLTERRVAALCKQGRIPGAVKTGGTWVLPPASEKPEDLRERGNGRKLPLPIGVADYKTACKDYYLVDKTLLIKEILDEKAMVSLFTRPRRFGKTLNMDMLRCFFENAQEDTSVYFRNKAIWQCGEWYRNYQGKYPVIFLSFKDIKYNSWKDSFQAFSGVLGDEIKRHLAKISDTVDVFDKEYYEKIVSGRAGEVELAVSLKKLSASLAEAYGIPPVIIIDEYDTPIHQGYVKGYYEEVISFMRNLFSGAFKDNSNLTLGFLTGILRVGKESIFSGLNNIKVNSLLDERYSTCFGFTAEEVRQMAAYYGVGSRFDEICEWYDGYRFGKADIFNPWSVVGYFNNDCKPQAFWMSTGSNEIIGEVLAASDEAQMEQLHALLNGETILTHIDTEVIYPELRRNHSAVFSFLLMAGYLKADQVDQQFSGDYMCQVSLPNREISYVYNKEILARMEQEIPGASASAIQKALYEGNSQQLQQALKSYLLQTVSYFDTDHEYFYHGLLLGLLAAFDHRYQIRSNRESGEGRYDIQMLPKDKSKPGILIEIKAGKNLNPQQLETLAREGLQQIRQKKYNTEMLKNGINAIMNFGVAFCGKQVVVQVE